jgi:hypothetical protein
MTKISDALTYGLTVRESATDGSDFTNPAADYRRLFLGEDGLLHVKDSAGAVTPPYAGSVATDAIWDAAGDLAVGSGANAAAKLTVGADSTVLTVSPTTHVPVWAAPAGGGGGLVLLEQHTAADSASLDFTTCISSTYDEYLFEFVNVILVTDARYLLMQMGTGGGPTYDTGANYGWTEFLHRAGTSAVLGQESGNTSIQIGGLNVGISNNAVYGLCGSVRLFSPQSATLYKLTVGQVRWFYGAGASHCISSIGGEYLSATALTAVRFLSSSGNIASGTIRVYGVAK